MFSLYIHIPYCIKKCCYCNFNSIPACKPPENEYVGALLKELKHYANDKYWQNRKIYTIYLGGGTPSLFSGTAIKKLLQGIATIFDTSDVEEITIEVNPGTITKDKLEAYKDAGINRISLGIQSFNPDILQTLGRIHTAAESIKAINLCKETDFKNISLDLMYAIPKQTSAELEKDLTTLISYKPEHISAYCLSIENGTPLKKMIAEKELTALAEEVTSKMFETVSQTLQKNGYRHYEISNFALENFEAKHNSAYWDNKDYLGIGAGAHSYCSGVGTYGARWSNILSPQEYINDAEKEVPLKSFYEELSRENAIEEFFMLNLRKKTGFTISDYEQRFKENFPEAKLLLIQKLRAEGLLKDTTECVALSAKGLLLADTIIEKFFV